GRSIAVKPKRWEVRPSTDIARQGLMNYLDTILDWSPIRALDLFAGTGALGLECLSRGASQLVSMDLHPEALGHLRQLRQQWDLKGWHIAGADLLAKGKADGSAFPWKMTERLSEFPDDPAPFDLVVADPPYGDPRLEGFADAILDGPLLSTEGILVIEHAVTYRRISLHYEPSKVLIYGQSQFSIFEKRTLPR
ncbi:MAG: RsmD family RNA methyltransferase, partial [Bacteroidota bacterium]